jgi:hypothetical protein
MCSLYKSAFVGVAARHTSATTDRRRPCYGGDDERVARVRRLDDSSEAPVPEAVPCGPKVCREARRAEMKALVPGLLEAEEKIFAVREAHFSRSERDLYEQYRKQELDREGAACLRWMQASLAGRKGAARKARSEKLEVAHNRKFAASYVDLVERREMLAKERQRKRQREWAEKMEVYCRLVRAEQMEAAAFCAKEATKHFVSAHASLRSLSREREECVRLCQEADAKAAAAAAAAGTSVTAEWVGAVQRRVLAAH